MAESQAALKSKYAVLFHHLDERQRRLVVVAADAERLGRGGVSMVAQESDEGQPGRVGNAVLPTLNGYFSNMGLAVLIVTKHGVRF